MKENNICPNCDTSLKSGLMSKVKLLESYKIDVINEYHDSKSEAYCSKCGKGLYEKYKLALINERNLLSNELQKLILNIPVISTHTPLNWNYEIWGMVTGQSTTGTGVVTEFTSSFTDLFGSQSGRHNKKLRAGENMCFAQLRKRTLDVGGNAVIATDIDYSEVGSGKGMLMVCMAGTAVRLKNTKEVLGEKRHEKLEELISKNKRLKHLWKLKTQDPQYNNTSG